MNRKERITELIKQNCPNRLVKDWPPTQQGSRIIWQFYCEFRIRRKRQVMRHRPYRCTERNWSRQYVSALQTLTPEEYQKNNVDRIEPPTCRGGLDCYFAVVLPKWPKQKRTPGEGNKNVTGENQSQEQILQKSLRMGWNIFKTSKSLRNIKNAAGTDGYDDTVLYIIEEGQNMVIRMQDFTFSLYNISQSPTIQTPEADLWGLSILVFTSWQGEGVVSAVDVQIPPGEEANSSTSGCEESDFEASTPGDIALIQREVVLLHKAQLVEQFLKK